jgi:hypothetical protein
LNKEAVMSRAGRWWIVLAVLLALAVIAPPLFMTGWMWGRGGAMGFYPMMRLAHMPGYFPGGGWQGIGLRALVPVGVIVLAAWGLASLFARNVRKTEPGASPARACASCGRAAQAEWSTCPYCGKLLA